MSAYTDAVERGLKGMEAVSTGTCPGCKECMDRDGVADAAEHRASWSSGDLNDGYRAFSWRPCGICGSTLGGDRERWHWVSFRPDGRDGFPAIRSIEHEDDACTDCVMYLANGDEPSE